MAKTDLKQYEPFLKILGLDLESEFKFLLDSLVQPSIVKNI